ncbi:hypothetical protein BVRB_3g057980 [Beta vulgaris subsp. vulgaris]|nr:hypothetical protein BVRB_3g057980 [Beta vulgaris subsp. vulgaris]
MARFLVRLKPSIANLVELQQYAAFNDLCLLASKVERQQHGSRFKKNTWQKHDATSSAASTSPSTDSTLDKAKEKELDVNPSMSLGSNVKPKKTICFRCQGLGHVAKNCPYVSLVTREDYFAFLAQETSDATPPFSS